MDALGFHGISRNGPKLSGPINLAPTRSQHFGRAGSRQDRELKRQSGHPFPLTQFGNESWKLGVGQGRVMPDPLRTGREQQRKMTSPARWIISGAPTVGGSRV